MISSNSQNMLLPSTDVWFLMAASRIHSTQRHPGYFYPALQWIGPGGRDPDRPIVRPTERAPPMEPERAGLPAPPLMTDLARHAGRLSPPIGRGACSRERRPPRADSSAPPATGRGLWPADR